MRRTAQFPIADPADCKRRLLAWIAGFSSAVFLDSNEYPLEKYSTWECLAAAGPGAVFQADAGTAFPDFKRFYDEKQDWLFGFFGYDLKNEVEALHSTRPDGLGLPDLYFFQPETVTGIRRSAEDKSWVLEIQTLHDPAHIFSTILEQQALAGSAPDVPPLVPRIPKPEYLKTIEAIRRHIVEGDVYEMNFCQEFYTPGAKIDPPAIFERLNALTRAPFAAYLRWQDRHLLCASPERFFRREGDRLISQPIKGTRRRHPDPPADARIRAELAQSEKDRAENVMIVDLVRNDLARHCRPGSVRVDELFGIYSFRTVHQMISTVSGRLLPDHHPLDALRDAFPMGSMTGAPKVMAMQLIEQYEQTRRGLFSGAVGYFDPAGNFDFNVVIRSILYHAGTGYLSCQVGGAIVYDSVPEEEYEECLVKINALLRALRK